MKKLLVWLLMAVPSFGLPVTTGYHRISQVFARGSSGTQAVIVPYATIAVFSTSTNLAATIYSDPLLSAQIIPSLVTADQDGNYDYYIPLGYCVNEVISYPGGGSQTLYNVCVVSGTTTGTIITGSAGQFPYYASSGTILSPISPSAALVLMNGLSLTDTSPQTLLGPISTPEVTTPSLNQTAVCNSAVVSDLGACINAATTASMISVSSGGGTATTVIAPQPGQAVEWGAGTYTVAGINCPDSSSTNVTGCIFYGQGKDATKIILATGADRDLMTSPLFSSLTGGTNYYGSFGDTLENLTMDGNKSTQSGTSYCYRMYGRAPRMTNVTFQNCLTGGRWTEWNNDSTFASPADDLEGRYINVDDTFTGGTGWTNKGPHDSTQIGGSSFQNSLWDIDLQVSMSLENWNGYIAGDGALWSHVNGELQGASDTFSTSFGVGLLIDSTGGPAVLSSSVFAGPIGLEMKQGFNQIEGIVTSTTTTGVDIVGGGCNCNLVFYNSNPGYWITFTGGEVGISNFIIQGSGGAGTLFSGSPQVADTVFVTAAPSSYGASNYTYMYTPKFYSLNVGNTATSMTSSSGNGAYIQRTDGSGVSGDLTKYDSNGNTVNGPVPPVGTIIGTTDTQTLTNKTVDGVTPTVFSYIDPTSSIQTQLNTKVTASGPTVGQAACIKAAGPPVVIGYCSTVVGAGGACTCN